MDLKDKGRWGKEVLEQYFMVSIYQEEVDKVKHRMKEILRKFREGAADVILKCLR